MTLFGSGSLYYLKKRSKIKKISCTVLIWCSRMIFGRLYFFLKISKLFIYSSNEQKTCVREGVLSSPLFLYTLNMCVNKLCNKPYPWFFKDKTSQEARRVVIATSRLLLVRHYLTWLSMTSLFSRTVIGYTFIWDGVVVSECIYYTVYIYTCTL